MSNFKIGEKVVFLGTKNPTKGVIYPEINEIVTIKSFCNVYKDGLDILEYPRTIYGNLQSISSNLFRKLDYAHTERICAEIIESLKVEEFQMN